MIRRLAALALSAVMLLSAAACTQDEESPKRTAAPVGTAFYRPPSDLSDYSHGDLIWSRKADSGLGLANADVSLVLYAQQGVAGKTVATSGFVATPQGEAPQGGWPVVTWAHGTTGMADQCAPTRGQISAIPGANSTATRLQRWIDSGHVVVGTDYEGLGTPGDHPYLIGSSQGRAVLDIVRAARQLDAAISKRVLVSGHSQGGHAALWASSMAPHYARELEIVGTVAFAPPSHMSLAAQAALSGEVNVPAAFVAMILRGLEVAYPDQIPVDRLLNAKGRKLYPQVSELCLLELFGTSEFGLSPMSKFAAKNADPDLVRGKLDANDPSFPTIRGPILIAQGTADDIVPLVLTDSLAKAYRGRNLDLTYTKYRGAGHSDVLDRSVKQVEAFTADAFAG
ncbi:alpha/beta fold hydrolase [Aeromicrobium duanguangcaii]|uniref:alpha/beta fold hydrolase n=1 Tax=Aeromicrobium duanguangcaii TaxID=2968086 RepID=UPI002017FD14|nr:alpha/beta fold hydrolase [Aeromicrobium duanguangcaii]